MRHGVAAVVSNRRPSICSSRWSSPAPRRALWPLLLLVVVVLVMVVDPSLQDRQFWRI
jgi:hypothetical protein